MKYKKMKQRLGRMAVAVSMAAVVGSGCARQTSVEEVDPKLVAGEAIRNAYRGGDDIQKEGLLGYSELIETMSKEDYQVALDLVLTETNISDIKMLEGGSLKFTNQMSAEPKRQNIGMGFIYQENPLVSLQMYFDEAELVMSIPEVSERLFAINYHEDLAGQIEQSPYLGPLLKQSAGAELDQFLELLEGEGGMFAPTAADPANQLIESWNAYRSESSMIDELIEGMTFKKGKEKLYQINGEEVNCQGYQIVVAPEAAAKFLEDTWNYLKTEVLATAANGNTFLSGTGISDAIDWENSTEVDEFIEICKENLRDVTMEVYVDDQGRLVAMDVDFMVKQGLQESKFQSNLQLMGGNHLGENYEFHLTLDEGRSGKLTIDLQHKINEDAFNFLLDMVATDSEGAEDLKLLIHTDYQVGSGAYQIEGILRDDVTEMRIDASGTVTHVVKGKELAVDLTSATLTMGGDTVGLAGSYSSKPMEGEFIVPEGERMDILAATEQEWMVAIMEMYTKVTEIAASLQP